MAFRHSPYGPAKAHSRPSLRKRPGRTETATKGGTQTEGKEGNRSAQRGRVQWKLVASLWPTRLQSRRELRRTGNQTRSRSGCHVTSDAAQPDVVCE
jgi:hypothetical protein